jgi:hypothetical protein
LGTVKVPFCEGIVFEPRAGQTVGQTSLVHQTVTRRRYQDSGPTNTPVREQWLYLIDLNDEGDVGGMGAARVPVLGDFIDEARGWLNAPIVSLCRLSPAGGWVESYGFNLDPRKGSMGDMRFSQQPFDYYFQSATDNYDLLFAATCPKCRRAF